MRLCFFVVLLAGILLIDASADINDESQLGYHHEDILNYFTLAKKIEEASDNPDDSGLNILLEFKLWELVEGLSYKNNSQGELHLLNYSREGDKISALTEDLQARQYVLLIAINETPSKNSTMELSIESIMPLGEVAQKIAVSKAPSANEPVPSGEYQIQRLVELFKNTECQRSKSKQCIRGTVKIDPWLQFAQKTQRELQVNLPLNLYHFIGSHNSFNNRADGYGKHDLVLHKLVRFLDRKSGFMWAQQEYSMTDQLNMGLRELHLDVHYFGGRLVMCHGGVNSQWVKTISRIINVLFGTKIEPAHIGCTPNDRTFAAGLAEINQWLEENPKEFLFIHYNDQRGWTTPLNTPAIHTLIVTTFRDKLFTPVEKFVKYPFVWPSVKTLVKSKRQIMFQGEDYYASKDGTIIFRPLLSPDFKENCVNRMWKRPKCQNMRIGAWSNIVGESQIVGPFYDGTKDCGLIVPENLPFIHECPMNVMQLDQVSPTLLNSSIWSWDVGHPRQQSNTSLCVKIASNGRWQTDLCSKNLPYVCRIANGYNWTVSSVTGKGTGVPLCPSNSAYSVPHNAMDNAGLRETLKGHEAWLNLPLATVKTWAREM